LQHSRCLPDVVGGLAAVAGNDYATLKPHLAYRPDFDLTCADPEKDDGPQIFSTSAAVVVFYCNHCSSSSPSHAADDLAWLRRVRPESRQEVKVLRSGMAGLLRRARELGRANEFFTSFR
jgi:hypothetical protein